MDNFVQTRRGADFFDRDVPMLIKSIKSLTEAVDRHTAAMEAHTKALRENTECVFSQTNGMAEALCEIRDMLKKQ